MNKSWWLDIAETLDALRVFPRLLLPHDAPQKPVQEAMEYGD